MIVRLAVYGGTDVLEADDATEHELAITVAGEPGKPPVWAAALLRHLARYERSQQPLNPFETMTFTESIARVPFPASSPRDAQDTGEQRALLVVPDPLLTPAAGVPTPVLRIYGITQGELRACELWSPAGVAGLIARAAPALVTDLTRASFSRFDGFSDRVAEGVARDGCATSALVLPRVRARVDGRSARIELAGGDDARHLARVLGARRAQGDRLLVHEPDDAPGTMIGFVPGKRLSARREGPVLVVELPPQAPLLAELARGPALVEVVVAMA